MKKIYEFIHEQSRILEEFLWEKQRWLFLVTCLFFQYQVRYLFVTSIHQFIFTNPRISFNEIWCYDYFNDAVKCILMAPQDLENIG